MTEETKTELRLTLGGMLCIIIVIAVFALGFVSGERITEQWIAGAIRTLGAK